MPQTGTGQTAHTRLISLGSWSSGTLAARINTFLTAQSTTWPVVFGSPSPLIRMPLIRVHTTSASATLSDSFSGSIPVPQNQWFGPFTFEDMTNLTATSGTFTALIEC